RTKPEKDERCEICEERRRGRLTEWLKNRENTIWTDEVADVNNRLALLTLDFNLDKWLDGTMIGTIYSQSFEDWYNGKKIKKENNVEIEKDTVQLLKDFQVLDKIQPTKESIFSLLEQVIKNLDSDKKMAAGILNTFFQDVNIDEKSLYSHINNIKERIKADNLTKNNLATYLFTQNPSPARLYRIWRETEEFFELVVNEIKSNIYSYKWKRIKFSVDYNDLKSKLNSDQNIDDSPFIIKVEDLTPEDLLVFHDKNGEFYTIESLEKFKFGNKIGKEAVKEALSNGFKHLAPEDEPTKNLLKNGKNIQPSKEGIKVEEYYPFIEITKSPLSLRLIISALDSIKILELVINIYNKRFSKVIGKLPLNIRLLVSKRKFPLYVLLEAGERMLQSGEFKKPVMMNVWWNLDGMRNNEYYGFYPTKILKDDEKYTLDDLVPLSDGKTYALYPGFFDYDLLSATTDRYNISYKKQKRGGEDYSYYSARPYYFYQISQIIELWEILKNNLSSSKINYIEEILTGKLREWRNVSEANKDCVFRKFVEATLKDAFTDRWEKLRKETQDFIMNSALNGLLLDTVVLFRHIIKEKEAEENE
ncbi:MAG: CRISPR-associated protein Csx11, partial [Candidatus Aminicenantes bacterium]